MSSRNTSRSIRIVSILNLCLVFAMLAWIAGYPFMGEHYEYRSKLMIFKTVMGNQEFAQRMDGAGQAKLERNFQRFSSLPTDQKQELEAGYRMLQQTADRSWHRKTIASMQILGYCLSPFLQAWLLLSIILCILLLKESPGACAAVWLLPLIAGFYAIDNYIHGYQPPKDKTTELFPSEEYLATNYINEKLSANPLKQREQLLAGWNKYLALEWAEAVPMQKLDREDEVSERGEFAFNLALAKITGQEKPLPYQIAFHMKKHPLILLLFFSWNLWFAFSVYLKKSAK